jgi:hypothetical protein
MLAVNQKTKGDFLIEGSFKKRKRKEKKKKKKKGKHRQPWTLPEMDQAST